MKTITKLTVELVPRPSWGKNLRLMMGRRRWDKFRKKVYAEFDNECGICGWAGKLNCHEIWEYDDKKHIQKLTGFIALCNFCHNIKNLGRSHLLIRIGRLNGDELVSHFQTVNECSRHDYNKYVSAVFDQYIERSSHEWTVDFGDYDELLKEQNDDSNR